MSCSSITSSTSSSSSSTANSKKRTFDALIELSLEFLKAEADWWWDDDDSTIGLSPAEIVLQKTIELGEEIQREESNAPSECNSPPLEIEVVKDPVLTAAEGRSVALQERRLALEERRLALEEQKRARYAELKELQAKQHNAMMEQLAKQEERHEKRHKEMMEGLAKDAERHEKRHKAMMEQLAKQAEENEKRHKERAKRDEAITVLLQKISDKL